MWEGGWFEWMLVGKCRSRTRWGKGPEIMMGMGMFDAVDENEG